MRPIGVIACAVAAILEVGAASTRRPGVRLENGILINSRAGYNLTVPQGWQLDGSSDSEHVKLVHPDSHGDFQVLYQRARGTPTMYYEALRLSLDSPDMHWISLGKGFVTLGGREAMAFRGTREKGGKKVKQFFWVALMGDYSYNLSAAVDLDKFEERSTEIDTMFSSFAWGVPPKTP